MQDLYLLQIKMGCVDSAPGCFTSLQMIGGCCLKGTVLN